jgi:hypothetical protein
LTPTPIRVKRFLTGLDGLSLVPWSFGPIVVWSSRGQTGGVPSRCVDKMLTSGQGPSRTSGDPSPLACPSQASTRYRRLSAARHRPCHATGSSQWDGWPTPGRVTMRKQRPGVRVKALRWLVVHTTGCRPAYFPKLKKVAEALSEVLTLLVVSVRVSE